MKSISMDKNMNGITIPVAFIDLLRLSSLIDLLKLSSLISNQSYCKKNNSFSNIQISN